MGKWRAWVVELTVLGCGSVPLFNEVRTRDWVSVVFGLMVQPLLTYP